MIAEEQREVSRYNDYAQRLNKSAGYTLMKLKKGRYAIRYHPTEQDTRYK
jgi:hypothetical protein